ncbi:hypothetical protein OPQ81_000220 [Rhizoctonia solani]|nr:hypothetical protein OPQ81_000220 [Rhizoctonia solani]
MTATGSSTYSLVNSQGLFHNVHLASFREFQCANIATHPQSTAIQSRHAIMGQQNIRGYNTNHHTHTLI